MTEMILSGKNVLRHTDRSYYLSESAEDNDLPQEEYVPRVCEFLSILKKQCDIFYGWGNSSKPEHWYNEFGRHETNYEDLYYLLEQMRANNSFEHGNPAIEHFIRHVDKQREQSQLLNSPLPSGVKNFL